jgi:hypothetical protein
MKPSLTCLETSHPGAAAGRSGRLGNIWIVAGLRPGLASLSSAMHAGPMRLGPVCMVVTSCTLFCAGCDNHALAAGPPGGGRGGWEDGGASGRAGAAPPAPPSIVPAGKPCSQPAPGIHLRAGTGETPPSRPRSARPRGHSADAMAPVHRIDGTVDDHQQDADHDKGDHQLPRPTRQDEPPGRLSTTKPGSTAQNLRLPVTGASKERDGANLFRGAAGSEPEPKTQAARTPPAHRPQDERTESGWKVRSSTSQA